MREPKELCCEGCELKGQCYICKTMLCAHKVIEHLDKGHIIWPLPYHVRFNAIFDEEDRVIEFNDCFLEEFVETSTRRIIGLQELEEEVEKSVYVTKDPFTIDQVRERLDAILPISDVLSRLENQIKELIDRFVMPIVISGSADNTIRIWKDGQARVLEGHTDCVMSIAVSLKKGLYGGWVGL